MAKRHDTQLNLIRKHLTDGHTITPLEALNLYGCFRLSAIIFILRHDEDLPICIDYPEATDGKPYARYWIDKEYFKTHPKEAIA